MGIVTAKQLKQKTGEIIKRVKAGERLTLTHRGKPVAVIEPPRMQDKKSLEELRPFDEAWKDIEQALKKHEAPFKGWQEATDWVRKRVSS